MAIKDTDEIRNPWADAQVGVDAVPTLHVDSVATLVAHFNYHQWDFEILGVGPMITSPVYLRKWRLYPWSMDSKLVIPQEALQRLKYVKDLGLNIQGEIIAHEIVKPKKKNIVHVDWLEASIRMKEATENAGEAISVAGKFLGTAALGMLVIPSLVLVDPILVLVIDNVRIGIFEWLERPGNS